MVVVVVAWVERNLNKSLDSKEEQKREGRRGDSGGRVSGDSGRAVVAVVVLAWVEKNQNKSLDSRITLFTLKDRFRLSCGCGLFLHVRATTQHKAGPGREACDGVWSNKR